MLDALQGSGLPQTAQDNLAMLIAATAGGAVGGMDGAAAGYNEAANNATYTLALCRATPVCVSALSGVLGGSAATALLEGDTSITGDPSTDAGAKILLGHFAEAVLFLSDVTGGERTEYPAETDTLPLGTESPAHPIDRPGRYDSPIAEQEGWSSELPIAGPAYGDHTSGGGYQILDPETQQLIGGAVYSEGSESGSNSRSQISETRANHILRGDGTGGGHLWPGAPGKNPFPQSWSSSKVLDEINSIASNPSIPGRVQGNGRIIKEAIVDRINVRVVIESPSKGGGVVTAFPTNVSRNAR